MKTFSEFLEEGKEEAAEIRKEIKKEFGLSSRDVSVKVRAGGGAVNVSLRTLKSLPFFNKIKKIGQGKEKYTRDERTQEILSGGNTFIFVDIDYKLEQYLKAMIDKELEKKSNGSFNKGDRVTLFKTFSVDFHDETTYIVSATSSKGKREHVTSMYKEGIPNSVLSLISKLDDGSLYARIV